MSMFIDVGLKLAAAEAIERLKVDIFQDEVGIAFLDMRGLPSELNTQEALQCYRQYGLKALKDLCVGFACIICDLRSQCLIFASDSLGHTPLFYYLGSANIIVSNILGHIQSRTEASIDQQSFDWYFLCGFVPGSRTMYKNISKLVSGEYIIVEKGRAYVRAYDDLPTTIHGQDDKLRLDLDNSLRSSVKRTIKKNTGVMLSGGFDSSLLCWLVKCYQKEVRTFALGSSDLNQDTLDQSIRMAKVLETKHEIINVSLKEALAALPLTVRLMDEPIVDLDTAVIYPALRKVPAEIKFLLHGFGSDQIIGNDFGYLKELSEAMAVFPDFDKYKTVNDDPRGAGLFFIREKMPQAVRLLYRLSPGSRGRIIFPFFEQAIVNVALQMPQELRSNKKLLRSLAPSVNKILRPNPRKRDHGQGKGQIPEVVRDFIRQVYGRDLMQNRLLQSLMGKSQLQSVVSSGRNEKILKLVVFNLWYREMAVKREKIKLEEFQEVKTK